MNPSQQTVYDSFWLRLPREILAGITTFFTMSYIIFVNPAVLSAAGMDYQAVFLATCLVAALGSILMGGLANYPLGVAPGMALNIYFTYVVVDRLGLSWQDALGAVLISGCLFLMIVGTRIRQYIIQAVPKSLNTGITVGLGFFIMTIAFRNLDIDIMHFAILHPLHSMGLQLGFVCAGGLVILICMYYNIPGAVLWGILVPTVLGGVAGWVHYHGMLAWPGSLRPTLFHYHFRSLMTVTGVAVIFSFLFIALFDCLGTLMGALHEAQLLKHPHTNQRIRRALLSNGLAILVGSTIGTSSVSSFLESVTGIRMGGRSGMTAIVIGILFLFAIFFAPLARSIPNFATAPALFFVGCLMIAGILELRSYDYTEIFPTVCTMVVIPTSGSIANGIGAGILMYTALKMVSGQWQKIDRHLLALSLLFVLYFSVLIWMHDSAHYR